MRIKLNSVAWYEAHPPTPGERGYRCHALPMSEFIKAGGACKCLVMFMPQREPVS